MSSPNTDADWSAERQEWLDAIDAVRRERGDTGVRELLRTMQDHLSAQGLLFAGASLNTPYRNSIPVADEPPYPGDMELEERIENILRWNAVAMVLQAADTGSGVGGHIATYLSASTLMEVGFHHIFRGNDAPGGGDMVNFQAHSSPGVYARAWLEGRLSRQQLANFRRELAAGGGLPSYPHPRRMPTFWQMPCASMGLSTPSSIYMARFARYLENRGLLAAHDSKIWTFIGDGEADEPEVLGTINIAARERLDNLVLIVNCNLQRLDGPVRGNGKIIQELERSFRGADWHVIKVIWGGGWDPLFARDRDGILQRRMEEALDGDYQYYTVSAGDRVREHWVEDSPALAELMKTVSDEEIRTIRRGGHDRRKVYAAFEQARSVRGKPVVILAKTVKGDGLGPRTEGRNTIHQKKFLNADERRDLAARLGIPITDEQAERAEFYAPPEDSPEVVYLRGQRQRLGGYLPARRITCPALPVPAGKLFDDFRRGSGERLQSTTMVLVRMLSKLLRDEQIGRFVVPIIPDEARTFGMDGLFPQAGIYSPVGQLYQPTDDGSIAPYREAPDGQILQEGICETGAMASFLAAGTAYANHGLPMIPFYIFYSIFGFQRVGDMIWAAGDCLSRGFLFGGTSGRTTLNGEGVQHQDGHSQLIASTVPNLVSYDPAFGFELAIIVRDGIRRMYTEQERIFYYITVTNQAQLMPPQPASDAVETGVLRGLYRFRPAPTGPAAVHLFGSGAIMTEVLEAAERLEALGWATDVWSVTSYNELTRNALATERVNRHLPPEHRERNHVQQALADADGVFVAASDFQKSVPGAITQWIPGPCQVLGTDGYGLSDGRPGLRDYFEVDARWIAWVALAMLTDAGKLERSRLDGHARDWALQLGRPDPASY